MEGILRASDLEDQREQERRLPKPQLKPGRGRESRHAGSLHDVDEQRNFMSQFQVLADDLFAAHMRHRDAAAIAFLKEHAKETWRRAISGRNTPMRGPYVQSQMVYGC